MSIAGMKIITKGLGGRACEGIITTHFSLYCTTKPPEPPDRGSGGGLGGAAGTHFSAIANPTVTNNTPMPHNIQRDDDDDGPGRVHLIIMRMKIGKYHHRREYTVPEQRAKRVAKVLSVINRTKDNISVQIHSVGNAIRTATLTIKNFMRRD